jgi:hypothetical protein
MSIIHKQFSSFYFLRRPYRTASQQMLKISIAFSKTRIHQKCCLHSVLRCLILYLLVGIRVAECCMNISKRLCFEAVFENAHTFWTSMHHVRTCTASAQLAWAVAQQSGWSWFECYRGGWDCFWFRLCAVVRDCSWVAFQMAHPSCTRTATTFKIK